MKTFSRIAVRALIVLAVAALVSGAFYFGLERAGLLAESGPGGDTALMQPPAGADDAASGAVRPQRGHGEEEGASLMAAMEIVKDAVIIALIVLVVAGGQWLYARIVQKRRVRPAFANMP